VYRAFTDPGQLAQWFGPAGCSVPRDSIEIDARPGGHLRFVMTAPDVRSPVDATFTDVVENELLAGEMEAAGVPGVAGPLRVHLRLEFHDEGNGKTRLELRQGPFATGQLGADTRSGWEGSFTKLDTLLRASLAPDPGLGGHDGQADLLGDRISRWLHRRPRRQHRLGDA
jgi:uncharacterized protein YndB with AHSA1/START domain